MQDKDQNRYKKVIHIEKAIDIEFAALIILLSNVIIHLFKYYAPDDMVRYYYQIFALYIGYFKTQPIEYAQYYRFLTSCFIHSDFLHLIMNMSIMLAFSKPIIKTCGSFIFIISFLLSGTLANYILIFLPTHDGWVIGASGCVSGLLGLALRFGLDKKLPDFTIGFLKNRKTLIKFVIGFIIFNIALALLPDVIHHGITQGKASQIAWDAHLLGFVIGIILPYRLLMRK